jgi:hypothetical protein
MASITSMTTLRQSTASLKPHSIDRDSSHADVKRFYNPNEVMEGYQSIKKSHNPLNFFHKSRRTMPSQQETNEKSKKRYENLKDSPEVSEDED